MRQPFLCLPCAQAYLTSTCKRVGRPSQTKRKASWGTGPAKRMCTKEQQEIGTPDVIGTAIRYFRGSYYKKAIQVLVHHSVASRCALLGVHGNKVKKEVRAWLMPDGYIVGTMSVLLLSLSSSSLVLSFLTSVAMWVPWTRKNTYSISRNRIIQAYFFVLRILFFFNRWSYICIKSQSLQPLYLIYFFSHKYSPIAVNELWKIWMMWIRALARESNKTRYVNTMLLLL